MTCAKKIFKVENFIRPANDMRRIFLAGDNWETMSFKRITASASPTVEKTSLSQPLSKIHRGNRYYKVTYRIYSNKRPISN